MLRKFLAIVLLAGFVFNGWGIFTPEKAKADPPAPSDPAITYAFTSTEHGGIMMKYKPSTGAEVSFDFVTAGNLVAPGTSVEGSVENNVFGAINKAGTTDYYWKYSNSANPGFFLLIGMKVQNADDPARPIGTYYSLGVGKMNGSKFGYELGFKTPSGDDISNTVNTRVMNTPAKINWTIDTNNACNQLVARWEGLASNMRDLLIEEPKDNPTYWDKNEPTGWRKAINFGVVNGVLGAATAVPGLQGAAVLGRVFSSGFTTLMAKWQGYDLGYYLNDAGMQKASNIRSDIAELKAITEQLKGSSGANAWPTAPPGCRPKALIGDTITLDPANFISTPDDFIAALDVLLKVFNDAISNASGVDEEDTCGNGLNKVAVIFQWMFCKVAEMIHGISNYVMKSAFGWLTLSLGTEIVQFSEPQLDTSINNVATSSSSGIPSTPGTTPGTSTPTPIHLFAKITFTRQSSYDATKASQSRIVSKIGPKGALDRPAETGSFAGTVEFISFNDSAKVVNVKINANQALPTGETVVSVLGHEPISGSGTSGQEVFLFIANATDFGNTAAAPKMYTSIL